MNKLLILAVLIGATACASYGEVLKWTGKGGNGNWSTPSNWETEPNWSQLNDLDLTALEDGAVVVNDAATKFGTLTLGANKGTIVIKASGKNVEYSSMKLVIPAGTTLDAQFPVSGGTWTQWNLTAQGGGTLWINETWCGSFTPVSITLDNVATRVKHWLYQNHQASFILKNGATLTADVDFQWGSLRSESSAESFDLNGHNVTFISPGGEFKGELKGAGQITIYGGGTWTLSGISDAFTGSIVQRTAVVKFSGNGRLGSAARIVSADTGRMTLADDQMVTSLSGKAARGGVTVPSGKTLTVSGVESGDTGTYGARLAGEGNFTLNAPGKTLVLSGGNALTGKTTVQAGTLIVRDPPRLSGYPEGLVHRYSFDGDIYSDDFGMNDLEVIENCKAPTRLATGVGDTGCIHFDGTDSTRYAGLKSKANMFISGTKPFTVSFWIRIADSSNYKTWQNKGQIFTTCKDWVEAENNRACIGTIYSGFPYTTLQGVWLSPWLFGRWHQLALVFDGKDLVLYHDGTYLSKSTKTWNMVVSPILFGKGTDADYDEMLLFNRALSAAEVKALFDTPIPEPKTDDTLRLPAPVAHWAFDDESNPGKDSSGNGYDLTLENGSASFVSGDGIYGKAIQFVANGAYLRWVGSGLPPKFPNGNSSFTVHIRTTGDGGDEGRTAFSMGNVAADNQSFRFGNSAYPRKFGYSITGRKGSVAVNYEGWITGTFYYDYTVVYDAEQGTISGYRDGVLAISPAKATANISADGAIYVSYNPEESSRFVGAIDDLQVFDRALDAQQVRRLVQSLETGSVPPALDPNSEVVVASGATLQYMDATELIASISRPAVAGSGKVVLPKSMKVSFSDAEKTIYRDRKTRYPIVEASEIVGPVDLSTWTFSPTSDKYKVSFVREGSAIYLDVKRRLGLFLVVK